MIRLDPTLFSRSTISLTKRYIDEAFLPVFSFEDREIFEVTYTFGSCTIAFRSIDNQLLTRLTRAFSHRARGTNPEAVVWLWDSVRSGTPLPPFTADSEYYASVDPKSYKAAFLTGEESLSAYDSKTRVGHFWISDAMRIPGWLEGAPLRVLLNWIFQEYGLQLMHAAGIAYDGRAILIAGKSGSGKSTTALKSIFNGFSYLGDDYVAVGETGEVVSVYQSMKLEQASLRLVPESRVLTFEEPSRDDQKGIAYLAESFPDRVIREANTALVVVPKMSTGSPKVTPLAKARALLALSPTTLFQLPYGGTYALRAMKNLLERVPAYELMLGQQLDEVPNVLRSLLTRTP